MQKIFLDLERAKVDDEYFAEKLCGYVPFPYQKEVRWDDVRIMIRGGRRTGKDTTITKRRIIPFLFKNAGARVGVYAPGWEEADVFMDIFRETMDVAMLSKSIAIDNKFDVTLTNKSRLICRIASQKSTGKRGRGFDLLYITEADFVSPKEMSVIRATRLIGSAPIIIASSVNGEKNLYQAEKSGKYTCYHWKTEMNPLIDPEELKIEKSMMTEIEAMQEYDAEYVSGEGQAIHDDLITEMYSDAERKITANGETNHLYYAGGDLGRRRDKCTMYILDVEWPHQTIVYYWEHKINKDDPRFWVKVLAHYIQKLKDFNIVKLRMDQTGMGDMPVIELRRMCAEQGISAIIEGVDFSKRMKHGWEGMMNQCILKFEQKVIHGPFIKQLVMQLKSIRINKETKMYEVNGPSPDHVMGLFLAMSGVTQTIAYFGTAAGRFAKPEVYGIEEEERDTSMNGYALKASEMGPAKLEEME